MYFFNNLEKKLIIVVILIRNTMLRECVETATTNTVGTKSLGTVLTKNSMPMECVRIAISTAITRRRERRKNKSEMKRLS